MVMELIKDNFIIQHIGCTIAQFMYGHISVTVLARMYMYMYENFALPNDNAEPKKATMNRSEDQVKEE